MQVLIEAYRRRIKATFTGFLKTIFTIHPDNMYGKRPSDFEKTPLSIYQQIA